ncbi:MAG: hypothetical protein J6W06_05400 [Bacteroidales bacterium]|nr:hypothetical protein [Bacteroidales bacterium]
MKKPRFLIFAVITLAGMLAISGFSNDAFGQSGTLNGHEYVDLGLPSGTKWATCNVGATSPKEYGDYFAWGETKPKNTYTEETYMYFSDPATLPSSADAATANWGAGWRMPTKVEWEELKSKCKWTWMSNGYKVVGPNGNGVFLPAAGIHPGRELTYTAIIGNYWSSSLYADNSGSACSLYFYSGIYDMFNYNRYYGLSVRPVCNSVLK